jgi:hypothetical protein
VIPAGSVLELDDKEYLKFEAAAKPLIKSGELKMLVAPKKTLEEQAAEDLARLQEAEKLAKELKEKLEPKVKPKAKSKD